MSWALSGSWKLPYLWSPDLVREFLVLQWTQVLLSATRTVGLSFFHTFGCGTRCWRSLVRSALRGLSKSSRKGDAVRHDRRVKRAESKGGG